MKWHPARVQRACELHLILCSSTLHSPRTRIRCHSRARARMCLVWSSNTRQEEMKTSAVFLKFPFGAIRDRQKKQILRHIRYITIFTPYGEKEYFITGAFGMCTINCVCFLRYVYVKKLKMS